MQCLDCVAPGTLPNPRVEGSEAGAAEPQTDRANESCSLADMVDWLQQTNPEFIKIAKLQELDKSKFEDRALQRPVGYAADTRVHSGRLCVPMLSDSDATCVTLTQERAALLLNHVMRCLEGGSVSMDDYNDLILQLHRYKGRRSKDRWQSSSRLASESSSSRLELPKHLCTRSTLRS